jgi:hypothetical protein
MRREMLPFDSRAANDCSASPAPNAISIRPIGACGKKSPGEPGL